jgi:hypothetical protein
MTMKTLTKADKLWFGQHRGSTVAEVLDDDPGYLLWAIRKQIFSVSTALYEEIRWAEQEECSDEEYYSGCPEQS